MFNWEKKLQYCKTYIQSFLIRSLDHVGMYSRRPSVLSFFQKYIIDPLNLLLFNFINLNTLEFLCIHTFRWRIRITLKKIKDFKLPQHIYRQHFHSLFCNIDFLEKLLTPLIFYSEPIEFLKVVKASLVRVWKQFSAAIQLKNGWKVAFKATHAKRLANQSETVSWKIINAMPEKKSLASYRNTLPEWGSETKKSGEKVKSGNNIARKVQQALGKLFSFNVEANWKATQNLFELPACSIKISEKQWTLTRRGKGKGQRGCITKY